MADDIHEFEKLLKQTVKSIKGIGESINESPLKGFDEIVKIRENFHKIGKLNQNESIFENQKDLDECIGLLGKVLKFLSKLASEEDSYVRSILSNAEVQEVLKDLQKRHRSLVGK